MIQSQPIIITDNLNNNISNIGTDNINNTSLVQSSLSVLLNRLNIVGYFKPHKKRNGSYTSPDERINRILNCDNKSMTHRILYDCGCSIDISMGCMSRLCPICYPNILRADKKKAAFIVRNMFKPRFLTYGTKNYNNLTPSIYRKESLFKRKIFYCLRNQKYPKWIIKKYSSKKLIKKYRGYDITKQNFEFNSYVDVIEHKYNFSSDSWNLHHHIIWDGSYIPQELFSDLMRYFSKGESYYCYIQGIKSHNLNYNRHLSAKLVCSYITKYLGKTEFPNDINKQVEFYTATRHAHLITYYPPKKSVAYQKYKIQCPICHKGNCVGLYDLDEQGRTIFNLDSLNYFQEKKTPDQDLKNYFSCNELLNKIKHLLNLEGNADKVEEILSMKQIEDLLRKGYLYQPRFDTYKEFA